MVFEADWPIYILCMVSKWNDTLSLYDFWKGEMIMASFIFELKTILKDSLVVLGQNILSGNW